MVKGGSEALGMRSLASDLGVTMQLGMRSDASAAVGVARRRGVGKVRHIEASQVWLQKRVANGGVTHVEVDGSSNIADTLTE